jgi:hypothetical protein
MIRNLFRRLWARPQKAKQRVNNIVGPERLERRSVLSATTTAVVELAITGREVNFGPAGLPTSMEGDVYLNARQARSIKPIGKYEEVLTPILMDINADAQPDFVGTTGVATFTFFASAAAPAGLASVTTANLSYIQGISAAGELSVSSVGTVIGGTGLARHVSGSMTSASIVAFYPTFSMHTAATLELNAPVGRLLRTVTQFVSAFEQAFGATRDRNPPADNQRPDQQRDYPSSRDGDDSDKSPRSEDYLRAVDHVLTDIADALAFRSRGRNLPSTDSADSDLPLAA